MQKTSLSKSGAFPKVLVIFVGFLLPKIGKMIQFDRRGGGSRGGLFEFFNWAETTSLLMPSK